jgi:hypothetical protein
LLHHHHHRILQLIFTFWQYSLFDIFAPDLVTTIRYPIPRMVLSSPSPLAMTCILTSTLLLPSFAQEIQALHPPLPKRSETVGSACSTEGQWNCMTNSFQRCASGQWSAVMNCAAGTMCTPTGLTVEFRVQHDGTVDGSGVRSAASAVGYPSTSAAMWALLAGTVMILMPGIKTALFWSVYKTRILPLFICHGPRLNQGSYDLDNDG